MEKTEEGYYNKKFFGGPDASRAIFPKSPLAAGGKDKTSMMVGEGGSFMFLHRDYRDFFAAVHLSNEAGISVSKGQKPTGLNEQAMDYPVRRMME